MNLTTLRHLIAQRESETLELKRSTSELPRAGETLCAFLNGEGGHVVIGVVPDGKIVGQQVADSTLRDIAAMLGRFEPPARIEMLDPSGRCSDPPVPSEVRAPESQNRSNVPHVRAVVAPAGVATNEQRRHHGTSRDRQRTSDG
jgi:hypothetical protein